MDSRLEELLNKFYGKQLNSDEKEEFECLLKSSDEALKIFHSRNFINQATDAIFISKNIPNLNLPVRKNKFLNLRHWLVKTAAILTITLLFGLAYLLVEKNNPSDVIYNEVTATNAKVVSITLSDGSKVSLYSRSSLKYPNSFSGKKRTVKLDGEATFDIKSNPDNPFYVEMTDGTRVKAYGTKFSVRDYKEDNTISVYLERGIVDFETSTLKEPVTLKPDTKLLFVKNNKKYTVHNSTPNEYDAYEQGILLFNNKPLEEVILKLKNIYQTDIIIKDESLKEYHFTATIKNESIYQVLNMLSISSPLLQWKKEGEKIILTKKQSKSINSTNSN